MMFVDSGMPTNNDDIMIFDPNLPASTIRSNRSWSGESKDESFEWSSDSNSKVSKAAPFDLVWAE